MSRMPVTPTLTLFSSGIITWRARTARDALGVGVGDGV
jgi:hypothetical protein